MKEREFLLELQQRAKEQQQIMHAVPFPAIFITVSEWLGTHPWRLLIPLAFFLSVIFRLLFGVKYDDLILAIFGKI